MYNAVLPLAAGPARAAFDTLAGDSLASTRTAIIDDSHYVRDAINSHLQGVQGPGAAIGRALLLVRFRSCCPGTLHTEQMIADGITHIMAVVDDGSARAGKPGVTPA